MIVAYVIKYDLYVKHNLLQSSNFYSSTLNFAHIGTGMGVRDRHTANVTRPRCYENLEYKLPAGMYPLSDLYEICIMCRLFQVA